MARIRTIKPEFWTDEKLSECSVSARLVFIGCISFADDEGRMEFNSTRLRLQLFPCGAVVAAQLNAWLCELSERSLIRVYVVDAKDFLEVPGFAKHQRINRATQSKFPPFAAGKSVNLSERSVSPTPGTGTGTGKGSKKKRGTGGDVPAVVYPLGLDVAAWLRWLDYRKTIKKPIRPESLQAAIDEFAKNGAGQAAAVQHSIANGWRGLFSPNTDGVANGTGKQRGQPRVSALERVRQANERWLAEGAEGPGSGAGSERVGNDG